MFFGMALMLLAACAPVAGSRSDGAAPAPARSAPKRLVTAIQARQKKPISFVLKGPDTPEGLRIYGSGIVSSGGESRYCLDSPAPNRIGFDLLRVMRTRYRIDTYQKTYFVIDGFEQLMAATRPDFVPYYEQLHAQETIPAGSVLDSDRVYTRGTGEGWATDADF